MVYGTGPNGNPNTYAGWTSIATCGGLGFSAPATSPLHAYLPANVGFAKDCWGRWRYFAPGSAYVFQIDFANLQHWASSGNGTWYGIVNADGSIPDGGGTYFDGYQAPVWPQSVFYENQAVVNAARRVCTTAANTHGATCNDSVGTQGNVAFFGIYNNSPQAYSSNQSAIVYGTTLMLADRVPPAPPTVTGLPAGWSSTVPSTFNVASTQNGIGIMSFGVQFAAGGHPGRTVIQVACNKAFDAPRFAPCPPSANVAVNITGTVPEGVHDIVTDATTPSLGSQTTTTKLRVDRTAPTIAAADVTGTLAARDGRAVTDGTYQLNVLANDGPNRSGIKKITFVRDGVAQPPVEITCQTVVNGGCPQTAPAPLSVNTGTLSAGTHTIAVIAEDAAGNAMPVASAPKVTFAVDHAAAQVASITHNQSLTGWYGARNLTTSVRATDDASGVKRLRLTPPSGPPLDTDIDATCNDSIAHACPRDVTRQLSYGAAALGDGPARPMKLTASDALGQESPQSTWSVNVDTAAPAVTLSGAAWDARNTLVAGTPLKLQVSATDSVSGQRRSGVGRLSVQVDAQAPQDQTQTCTSSASQPCDLSREFTLPALASGTHTVKVTATDNSDPANSSAPVMFTLHVDREAPSITSVVHDPATPGAWRDDAPRAVTVGAHDDLSGVKRFSLALPGIGLPQTKDVTCTGPAQAPCPRDATAAFPYTTGALAEGASTVSVTALDAAGNASAPSSWSLKLDRTPPTASYSGALTQSSGQVVVDGTTDLRVDANDPRSGVKRIRFLVDGQEKLLKDGVCDANGCPLSLSETLVVAGNDYADGVHTVRVEITDLVATSRSSLTCCETSGSSSTEMAAATSSPVTAPAAMTGLPVPICDFMPTCRARTAQWR